MEVDSSDVGEKYAEVKLTSAARKRGWLQILGPGLITGAADDDPSGIATYAQAGAMFAYGMLWTLLFTWPMMVAAQELSARIGRVTGKGLAGNMRRVYSTWVVLPLVILVLGANVINLGADIAAMGDATRMMVKHGSPLVYATLLSLVSVVLQIFTRYEKYTKYLKWMTFSLLVYVATAFFGHVVWRRAIYGLLVPHLNLSGKSLAMFIAVIGTTISPYLFFWQASLETEDIKKVAEEHRLTKSPEQAPAQFKRIKWDTYAGMGLSNVIAFFIMLTMAITIGSEPGGKREIDSATDAAAALGQALGMGKNGEIATWLFALGIIGTGMLAIPVLAGSGAYALSETFKWKGGLDRKLVRAPAFYAVLAIATLLGLGINWVHAINPIQALVWSAVINGIVAVPALAVITRMSSNAEVMGKFAVVGRGLRWMGWITTGVMFLAAVGMFATWGS
jgi:NRAMP (natural resistance-associated macrophage protein)-like metal ion transporter